MPNKTAAKKYLRVSKKRHIRNRSFKEKVKTAIKKVRGAISQKMPKEEVQKLLKEVEKIIDKSSQKRIIKKNTAARKKSRLHREFHRSLEK